MSCDIDPINMCCWTHGVDLGPDECMEECCYLGGLYDDKDDFNDFDDEFNEIHIR